MCHANLLNLLNYSMCGIWGLISKCGERYNVKFLFELFSKILKRGPDNFVFSNNTQLTNIYYGFARLSILDTSDCGDQPFVIKEKDKTTIFMCNGELYDYKQIILEEKLELQSSSDCEIIPLLYKKYDAGKNIENFQKFMDIIKGGEFALSVIELDYLAKNVKVTIATDPCSVRPIFYLNTNKLFAFSSILSGLSKLENSGNIRRLSGGSIVQFDMNNNSICEQKYYGIYRPPSLVNVSPPEQEIKENIKNTLSETVKLMLQTDRPIGALLSGGLDSSLVVSIASKYLKKRGKTLKTFSIGMEGSTDEKYAKMVAEHCGTIHTHVRLSKGEMMDAIPTVIKNIETYDITTVRASVGQYLISKWIAENTDIKVLLVGDGSDELCSGYMYFHSAPSPEEMHEENCKLLKEIHLYDGLRADRGISSNGLEARLPFLNCKFIDLYLGIPPEYRMPQNGVEKWLLRSSFSNSGLLPDAVLWRRKEAFSDGVSSVSDSWHDLLKFKQNFLISDKDFEKEAQIDHCKPPSKEALYYRRLFDRYFGKELDRIIPHYWMPNWSGNISEPSARVLKVY